MNCLLALIANAFKTNISIHASQVQFTNFLKF